MRGIVMHGNTAHQLHAKTHHARFTPQHITPDARYTTPDARYNTARHMHATTQHARCTPQHITPLLREICAAIRSADRMADLSATINSSIKPSAPIFPVWENCGPSRDQPRQCIHFSSYKEGLSMETDKTHSQTLLTSSQTFLGYSSAGI